jgi:hypothetical protein
MQLHSLDDVNGTINLKRIERESTRKAISTKTTSKAFLRLVYFVVSIILSIKRHTMHQQLVLVYMQCKRL